MSFHKKNRTAFQNYLRAKYEMYTRAVDVQSYPYFIGIDPSDICQLRCTTCPTGIDNERKKQHITSFTPFRSKRALLAPDLFDCLMDELGESLFWINFYNYGEPLLNKHLTAFIRKARDRDIYTDIHTNLSLPLSDERIDEVMSCGLDALSASVDGFSQETYQRHRVGGNLSLVKSNLERLAAARNRLGSKTDITYAFLVFSFNEHELPATRAYCQNLGINFDPREAFIDDPSWLPSYRRNEKPHSPPPGGLIRDDINNSYWPLPNVADRAHPSCAWHYGYSIVTAGGPVAPCCPVARDKDDLGTVIPGEVSFGDIWTGDLMRKSRADFAGKRIAGLEAVETICTKCPYTKTIQHLYSVRDIMVMQQFHKVFGTSEPQLGKAFDLLSTLRYDVPLETLARDGDSDVPRHIFVGDESGSGPDAFVKHFEQQLAGNRPAALKKSG